MAWMQWHKVSMQLQPQMQPSAHCLQHVEGTRKMRSVNVGAMPLYPPPLAQARPQSQKSGQNGGSTPTPCLDKAVHARDTRDSKGVGEPSDGDGEGLRMGKSTLSKMKKSRNWRFVPFRPSSKLGR